MLNFREYPAKQEILFPKELRRFLPLPMIIGYAIAERLGYEGASVVVSSRKEANVTKAVENLRAKGLNVEGVVCHVGKADQRKKLFDAAKNKFGGLDILVSNAAVNPAVSPILETEDNVWDKLFEVNVKNSWQLAKEAYPELQKRGGGNIVFIASIAGYQPMEPLGPYSVTKTTLLGLTKAIANEVVHDNIRVNCVAPGIVKTKFAAAITDSEAGKEKSLSIVPMKRFGKPEEIAAAVAFLTSDDASYVTGETIVVADECLGYAHKRISNSYGVRGAGDEVSPESDRLSRQLSQRGRAIETRQCINFWRAMTSRRRFRLDSDRGIRDIFDILQNDDDSDIEEDTERNETEVDDFRAGHEQLDLNDEDIPERGQLPIRTRGWPRSRGADRSRVRSTVRSRSTRSRGRGGRTVHNARQIDEANGWSYKPKNIYLKILSFKIYVRLCLQLMNIQRNPTVFNLFPRLFLETSQRRNQSLCKSNEGKAS
ncbi:hypothetical protein EVAR_75142_1 [Eumeta japonica]|uniref:Dehydrogenase/reductase SDR family member 4 n=1 Tax=Eumeta variegata TaxID=151549 RepID=A0A4C1U0P2_EUMVA|nr:hypothetical protein EVAR_75142_1 [Eumeta japonica]